MNTRPSVSILMAFLNPGEFIREAIDSVLAQTFEDWELLMVDDGSTDVSCELSRRSAAEYPAKMIYLHHPQHATRGQAASRNLGIACARGAYVAILDADDVWLPHKLEQQMAILKSHSDAVLVQGRSKYWHSWTGRQEDLVRDFFPQIRIPTEAVYGPPLFLKKVLAGKVSSPCPSDLLFRRELLSHVGGFEEEFTGYYGMFEDQAFLTKVYLSSAVYVSSECWDHYRLHPDSCCATTVRAGKERASRQFYLTWLADYLGRNNGHDEEITNYVRRALWPYRHPVLARVVRPAHRIYSRISR